MCRFFVRAMTTPAGEPPAADDAERMRRVAGLTDPERAAFGWLRRGFTAAWTAETLLLDRKTARLLFASLYRRLGVADAAALCREYRTVPIRPMSVPDDDVAFEQKKMEEKS